MEGKNVMISGISVPSKALSTTFFELSCNGTAGDHAMHFQEYKCADLMTGEVRCPFKQVAGRAAQGLRRIRSLQVAIIASRSERECNRCQNGISAQVVRMGFLGRTVQRLAKDYFIDGDLRIHRRWPT